MTPDAPDPYLGPPPTLDGRYRLVRQIGKGGMSLVYRAEDELLGREVAIKFLSPSRIADSQRFLREARVVAQLSHPHIVTLYDAGQEAGWYYLILEHIAGQNLYEYLAEQPQALSTAAALALIRPLFAALAYAHERGVIHRDVKPENMMIMPDGRVKVTDFGLALADTEIRLTADNALSGTPLYLAPECLQGQPASPRSDLYAAGVVLYELLAGQPPYQAATISSMFIEILHTTPNPPSQHNPAIPAAVDAIILRLLAKEPDQRYPSAQAVLDALSGLTIVENIPATPRQPMSNDQPPLVDTLVERLARTSTAITPAQKAGMAPALFSYAAAEDTAVALETERQRLAGLLQDQVIEPLNLLLAQAGMYEQVMAVNTPGRTAVSVLATLARQLLQQVRDLETNLRPTILESLGLEPALEAQANQVMRARGVQITLELPRLVERLPASLELALFRATQEMIAAALDNGHATHITIYLRRQPDELLYTLADNGPVDTPRLTPASQQRVTNMGGQISNGVRHGRYEVTIRFTLTPPLLLTAREMEVIVCLAEGMTNKEIAHALHIKPRTVNFHLDNIYLKLGVSTRTEAAVIALRQGWVRGSGAATLVN
ncbi:MAG: protein kinase [Anaerolineae bacterium]|nr:protein kinase [Anaerolineae bacterium]